MKFLSLYNKIQQDYVSLFTREWIEIGGIAAVICWAAWVSLFTREWIEIPSGVIVTGTSSVSLFTREWIEIMIDIEGFRSYLVSLLQKNELTETNIIF